MHHDVLYKELFYRIVCHRNKIVFVCKIQMMDDVTFCVKAGY